MKKSNKKGFTLIELLIVIAIIALLATLAIISLTTAQRKARDTKRLADLKEVQTTIELFYSDNSSYPSNDKTSFQDDLEDFITIPNPPSDASEYVYAVTGLNDAYVLKGTLEDPDHSGLDADNDDNYTQGVGDALYAGFTWDNTGTETALAADVECDEAVEDGAYCLTD